jgi:hypothetical protein
MNPFKALQPKEEKMHYLYDPDEYEMVHTHRFVRSARIGT